MEISDVRLVYEMLVEKRLEQDTYWALYDGDTSIAYTDPRLASVFPFMQNVFRENWSSLVVDSINDRLVIDRIKANESDGMSSDALNDLLTALWQQTQLSTAYIDTHLNAFVTGEGYVVVGSDEDGVPEAYWNDSRWMQAIYHAEKPYQIRVAGKLFQDEAGRWVLLLYYDDRIERYEANGSLTEATMPHSYSAFTLVASEANTWSFLPVFHFRKELRRIQSELKNVAPLQHMVNKLLADMMVSAEYAAFPQRYIISQAVQAAPLKNAPNLVWDIPGSDGMGQPVSVGQLQAAELGNYIVALDRATTAVAAISKTPKFYFSAVGGIPSGEALRAVEAPLVKKVEQYASRFEPVWVRLMAALASMVGVTILPDDIDVVWRDSHTKTPNTDAEYVQTMVGAGVPLVSVLREIGWQESEIEQMEADRVEEENSKAETTTLLMAQAMQNQELQRA